MHRIRHMVLILFRSVCLVLFFFYLPTDRSVAQQNFYDTDLLSPEFHRQRRQALRELLPPRSIAFIYSNPVRNRSNDVDFQYIQDPDLYYLTGLMEPHSVLVVLTDSIQVENTAVRELLFVQTRDSVNEIWNGRRLGVEGASSHLGMTPVFANTEFGDRLPDLSVFDKVLVKFPSDIKESKTSRSALNKMVYHLREALEKVNKDPAVPQMFKALASLREIKQPEELVLMQKAIDITVEGLAEAIRGLKPGMTEYQAQAIVEFYFKYRGAEYPGYGSISGGGENSCVLHYVTNRRRLADGDLLLMDMGAEYHGYTADVTRTIPANGVFSEPQKEIYNLALAAQEAGIRACREGNRFQDPGLAAMDVIAKGLMQLGIINKETEARKYFNHGTSHYLGLEVHDPGNYGPLRPGMVITVEPGVYIPRGSKCDKKYWDIGIRIEDDVLITDNEPFVMSGKLPKTLIELEKLMKEQSLFDSLK